MTNAPKSPSQLASDAAESIRSLNHATLRRGHLDWEMPSDAYSVVGGLQQMAMYLPQAIGQVETLLTRCAADGKVGSTTGDPEQDLVKVWAALHDARAAATALDAALQRAHNATSVLTYED